MKPLRGVAAKGVEGNDKPSTNPGAEPIDAVMLIDMLELEVY